MARTTVFDCFVLFVLLDFPETRFGIVTSDMDYLSLRAGDNNLRLHLLQQVISVQSYGIRVYKSNFIYHHIEDNMGWLIQGGFPQRHFNFIKETVLWFPKDYGKDPQVFSIEDLQFGFIIWGISCGISAFAFLSEVLFELIKSGLKKLLRAVTGVILVVQLIRNRLNVVIL